jgi:hypothetical protein
MRKRLMTPNKGKVNARDNNCENLKILMILIFHTNAGKEK